MSKLTYEENTQTALIQISSHALNTPSNAD